MLRLICAFIILISCMQGADMRISLSFIKADSKDMESKIIIDLVDNVASRDFYAMLPLKLEFRDYVGKEKISPELPKRLNTQGLNGYEPSTATVPTGSRSPRSTRTGRPTGRSSHAPTPESARVQPPSFPWD